MTGVKDRKVIVCDNCFQASCWLVEFVCDDYQIAGTVELPLWILEKLDLENSDFWAAGTERTQ